MYEQDEHKHNFPEPNTYDYASQLMFDANTFVQPVVQPQPPQQQSQQQQQYLDFFHTNDPYEMFRYDYASSCSSSNATPPHNAMYNPILYHQEIDAAQQPYYPSPYLFNQPMPTLSTSSSSTLSSHSYTNESRSSGASQVYVRKACVSCKQSHVACDVQRPCARCVRLNKADTCVDAERKKRGRPCGSSKKKKQQQQENTMAYL